MTTNPVGRIKLQGDENLVYRSRMVGKEFNTGEMGGIFAGSPPLEAMRCLIHEAATVRGMRDYGKVVMVNDVARAFFEAPLFRQVCVEFPENAI